MMNDGWWMMADGWWMMDKNANVAKMKILPKRKCQQNWNITKCHQYPDVTKTQMLLKLICNKNQLSPKHTITSKQNAPYLILPKIKLDIGMMIMIIMMMDSMWSNF